MRLALEWGDGLSRLLRGIRRPLLVRTAPGSAHRGRLLDRRRKESEAAGQAHRRGLRPPRVPTLHAADRRHRIPLAARPDAAFSNFATRGSAQFAYIGFSEVRVRAWGKGEREEEERPMTLVRVKETDSGGGFTVLNLQMVTRVECSGYGAGQQERRATVSFSDGRMVELVGADAARVLNAMEDFAGYHRS